MKTSSTGADTNPPQLGQLDRGVKPMNSLNSSASVAAFQNAFGC